MANQITEQQKQRIDAVREAARATFAARKAAALVEGAVQGETTAPITVESFIKANGLDGE